MEGTVILLLSLCLAVGLAILITVSLHFHHWKKANRQNTQQETPSVYLDSILESAVKPLTSIEKRYLGMLLEGHSTEEISSAMHVEPSTVYTVKYRIRKKFPEDFTLPF